LGRGHTYHGKTLKSSEDPPPPPPPQQPSRRSREELEDSEGCVEEMRREGPLCCCTGLRITNGGGGDVGRMADEAAVEGAAQLGDGSGSLDESGLRKLCCTSNSVVQKICH